MKNRRNNLYCGQEHRIIPTLEALANAIQAIIEHASIYNKDGERVISDLNYASRIHDIAIFAGTAAAEVDKLIMIDNKEVETRRKKT